MILQTGRLLRNGFLIIKLPYQHGLKADCFGWYVAGYIIHDYSDQYIVLIGSVHFVFASSSYQAGYLVQPKDGTTSMCPYESGLYSYIASGHSSLVHSFDTATQVHMYPVFQPWYPPNTRQLHPMNIQTQTMTIEFTNGFYNL
jgi:hypothetical protein